MDGYLKYVDLTFEVCSDDKTKIRMVSDGVVETLDVIMHAGIGVITAIVNLAGSEFGFH